MCRGTPSRREIGDADSAPKHAQQPPRLLDVESPVLGAALWEATLAKVAVANPDYLEPGGRP